MRLPSFNDFSPGIIHDVRKPLEILDKFAPDFDTVVAEWDRMFFNNAGNKRARTNITATLANLGLMERSPLCLTDTGKNIMVAPNQIEASRRLIEHIIKNYNGKFIIEAVKNLSARSEKIQKESLKKELERMKIENLSTGTTDHTTLLNWMVSAELFIKKKKGEFEVNEEVIKIMLGVTTKEISELEKLPDGARIFLQILRKKAEYEDSEKIPTKLILDECLRDKPRYFKEDQINSTILKPLEKDGWISRYTQQVRGRGGKSGFLKPTKKLMEIPIETIIRDFDSIVPPELHEKINLPLIEVKRLLYSEEKFERGLGLELLVLKMILDIGLEPRKFRIRSKETAYAEVDLVAEGKNLLFSRWNFQCKNTKSNVSLGDVAKEVGIAIYSKAHVVVVVTTSDFSSEVSKFAQAITQDTHLQFLLIDKTVVNDYLAKGASILLDHVYKNAAEVMRKKQSQAISPAQ